MRPPLEIECPCCGRRPGYPCMKLAGVDKWGGWVEDEVKGGWRGAIDARHPHRERRDAAKALDIPGAVG